MLEISSLKKSEAAPKIRVLVVEAQLLFSKALSRLLALEETLEVVGDALELDLEMLTMLAPDVVLIDLDGADLDLDRTIEHIERSMSTRMCILTAQLRPEIMQRFLAAGAGGYVSKHASPIELIHALKAIMAGASYADPRIAGGLLRRVGRNEGQKKGTAALSPRESEIIRCIAQGLSNKDISMKLKLSEKTVKNHISRMFAKLNISARTQAAVHAIRMGLI